MVVCGGLCIAGAVVGISAVSGAIGALSAGDEITNVTNQDSFQYDYITNETIFDFENSYFEDGSNLDLRNYVNTSTSKIASQEASQTGKITDNTTLYIMAGVAVLGAYLYLRRSK